MFRGGSPAPTAPKVRKRRHSVRKRVYFVDQHTLLRTALCGFINSEPGLEFSGGEARPDYALEAINRIKPDIVIVGSPLGAPGALRFIEQLRRDFPSLAILAYSLQDDPFYVDRALRAGASAFVVKETGSEHLLSVIRSLVSRPLQRQPAVPVPSQLPDRVAPAAGSLRNRSLAVATLISHTCAKR
jgi:DNA-binding NarL/FixJ family response regulator